MVSPRLRMCVNTTFEPVIGNGCPVGCAPYNVSLQEGDLYG